MFLRSLIALLVVVPAVALAQAPARREVNPSFGIDLPFQAQGGVQYYYALLKAEAAPESSEAFRAFRALDVHGVWDRLDGPPHVLLSRLVYTVDRDVTFFSEARSRDVEFINAIAQEAKVSRNGDGTFRAAQTPANTFRIEYFDEKRVQALRSALPGLSRTIELSGVPGTPHAVVFQENRDFDRVMGFRTAEGSFTWTAHYAVAPGQTRIVVLMMSYLAMLPPFFLGGEERVLHESTTGALRLIGRLRDLRVD